MRSVSSSVEPGITHHQQQTRPMSQASSSRIDLAGKNLEYVVSFFNKEGRDNFF